MSGKPPKSEGPRDTNKVQDELAHGRTLLGCLRGTSLMTLAAVLWLLLNIYADALPVPWRPRPTISAPIATTAPIATLAPIVTPAPALPPSRTATPVRTPTPRR